MNIQPFPRAFYERDTVQVAHDLIGSFLLHKSEQGMAGGIIVETEAYKESEDSASHAFSGMNARNYALFGPVGHAYVYLSYGIHYCLNIVARQPHMRAGGVLIRALKPVVGIDLMRIRRKTDDEFRLMRGPGCVTQALGISLHDNGTSLLGATSLCVGTTHDGDLGPYPVIATSRIGISTAQDLLWRFAWQASPYVSGKRDDR